MQKHSLVEDFFFFNLSVKRRGEKKSKKTRKENLCTAKPNRYSKVEGGRWRSLKPLHLQHTLVSATMKKVRTKKHYFGKDPNKSVFFFFFK